MASLALVGRRRCLRPGRSGPCRGSPAPLAPQVLHAHRAWSVWPPWTPIHRGAWHRRSSAQWHDTKLCSGLGCRHGFSLDASRLELGLASLRFGRGLASSMLACSRSAVPASRLSARRRGHHNASTTDFACHGLARSTLGDRTLYIPSPTLSRTWCSADSGFLDYGPRCRNLDMLRRVHTICFAPTQLLEPEKCRFGVPCRHVCVCMGLWPDRRSGGTLVSVGTPHSAASSSQA